MRSNVFSRIITVLSAVFVLISFTTSIPAKAAYEEPMLYAHTSPFAIITADTCRLHLDNVNIPYGTRIYFKSADGTYNLNLRDGNGELWPLFKIYYNGNLIYEYGNFVYYHTPNDTFHANGSDTPDGMGGDGKYWTAREFVICQQQPTQWDDTTLRSNWTSSGLTYAFQGWSYKGDDTVRNHTQVKSIPTMTGDEIHCYSVLKYTTSYSRTQAGSPVRCGAPWRGDGFHAGRSAYGLYCTNGHGTRWDYTDHDDGSTDCDECGAEDVTSVQLHMELHLNAWGCPHVLYYKEDGYSVRWEVSAYATGETNVDYELTIGSQNTVSPSVMKFIVDGDETEKAQDNTYIAFDTDTSHRIVFTYTTTAYDWDGGYRPVVTRTKTDSKTYDFAFCNTEGYCIDGVQYD